MSDTEAVERRLRSDLEGLGDRLTDERFGTELYQGLTNRAWRHDGGPGGHLALSWGRAEALVNELRRSAGREPLALAQSGGEGELSATVSGELEALGWRSTALNTGRHDDQHAGAAASPPPEPAGHAASWEDEAHAVAERTRAERGQRA